MKAPRRTTSTGTPLAPPTVTVNVEIDPLVEVVRRHVKLSARASRLIEGDFARLLRSPTIRAAGGEHRAAAVRSADTVLSTQEAADLVGVSRPYIVARIEAGDIPLHQQVGSQRRVLKSAVEAWHRREQTRRRRALGQLGAELDDEIFSR
jgi:excisionase family DNA binding protein